MLRPVSAGIISGLVAFTSSFVVVLAGLEGVGASPAQAANMRMLQSQVLTTIEKRLGPGIVTRLDIVGPAAPSWRKGRRSIRGRGPRDTYG